jgi:hypothetical protein
MPETDARYDASLAPKVFGGASGSLSRLDELLRRALIALGQAGHADDACRIAAEAWSALRHETPREAERYASLLHRLAAIGQAQRKNAP